MSVPIQSSTNDQTRGFSGVDQIFGGINKSRTGINPDVLVIGAVVVAAIYLLSKTKGRK